LVIPNAEQPRREFDEAALSELAESISIFGVLQPLLVQKKGRYYEIIAGERRWRAAKLAGLKKVPVIVKEYSNQEVMEISLIENIQREDLNPIEEAMAFKRLIEEFELKQSDLASRVSKSRTAIANSMRLLKLDERVQKMLIDGLLSSGHARALLALEENESQFELATRIVSEALSVRETEKIIQKMKKPAKETEEKAEDAQLDEIFNSIEEQLKLIVGSKVSIKRKSPEKGKIEIEYYSSEELDRIIDLFHKAKGDEV
jgi:ParB family transcriptional regulator, chromosome partitioning protein